MTAYTADGPIYSSYVEAYLAASKANIPADAGSRTSTANYGYGPSGSAQRLRKSKNFVDGNPVPSKPVSVLHRPAKAPSAKNAENLDVQHERDKQAFQRRANVYRKHSQSSYHHHAPPGSILTTFEQGHIVDRGKRKSHIHESRGVYDPVSHSYRVEPGPDAAEAADSTRSERPSSVPPARASCKDQQPLHARSVTPFEHKLLQASRGTYNPLTHEYKESPEPEYARRKERQFERENGLGNGMRRVQPPHRETADPINWSSPKESPAVSEGSPPQPSSASACEAGSGSGAADRPAVAQRQRPTSAPSGPVGLRKSMAGPSWGTYNPLTHEWQVPPANEKFVQQDALLARKLGMSGSSAGRTATPQQQGVYNPILNTWTVPPANPRVVDGLSFQPATLFSKPTPATIRM